MPATIASMLLTDKPTCLLLQLKKIWADTAYRGTEWANWCSKSHGCALGERLNDNSMTRRSIISAFQYCLPASYPHLREPSSDRLILYLPAKQKFRDHREVFRSKCGINPVVVLMVVCPSLRRHPDGVETEILCREDI